MKFTLGQAEAKDLVETYVSSRDAFLETLNLDGLYPWYVEHAKKFLELYQSFHTGTNYTQVDHIALDLAYKAYSALYK